MLICLLAILPLCLAIPRADDPLYPPKPPPPVPNFYYHHGAGVVKPKNPRAAILALQHKDNEEFLQLMSSNMVCWSVYKDWLEGKMNNDMSAIFSTHAEIADPTEFHRQIYSLFPEWRFFTVWCRDAKPTDEVTDAVEDGPFYFGCPPGTYRLIRKFIDDQGLSHDQGHCVRTLAEDTARATELARIEEINKARWFKSKIVKFEEPESPLDIPVTWSKCEDLVGESSRGTMKVSVFGQWEILVNPKTVSVFELMDPDRFSDFGG